MLLKLSSLKLTPFIATLISWPEIKGGLHGFSALSVSRENTRVHWFWSDNRINFLPSLDYWQINICVIIKLKPYFLTWPPVLLNGLLSPQSKHWSPSSGHVAPFILKAACGQWAFCMHWSSLRFLLLNLENEFFFP